MEWGVQWAELPDGSGDSTRPPPPLPVIVTRIEPNDGLINANDVWVQAPATDTASNGIAATLAGKHSGKKKKKGRLQGVDCDGRL